MSRPASGAPPPRLRARGIVFDLDGTLIDSFAAIAASLNRARRVLGHRPLRAGEVIARVGWGLERLIASSFPEGERERALGLYREHHARTLVEGTRVLPGVEETLRALRARGHRLAVATNKASDFARELLDRLGLRPHLDLVLGADDVARPKPDPEMLRLALARLGVAAAEALYVGDMEVDVETARAAGVPVVLVATGSRSRDRLEGLGALRVVDGIGELLALTGA